VQDTSFWKDFSGGHVRNKKKALDALFLPSDSGCLGPVSKLPVTSVKVTLGVGGGDLPFPKVSFGNYDRSLDVSFRLFQAVVFADGASFSSGMVVSVPAASNNTEEQMYAIVGFAQAKGPPRSDTSEQAKFVRSGVQGFYAIMAKVQCAASLSVLYVHVCAF
jgi:hypothetical protein